MKTKLLYFFKRFQPYLRNKYLLTFFGLGIWMLFFDEKDVFFQLELRKKLNELESEKQYFIEEISKNKSDMQELMTDRDKLEKFAREKYLMKKDNEDIFVIVKEEDEKTADVP